MRSRSGHDANAPPTPARPRAGPVLTDRPLPTAAGGHPLVRAMPARPLMRANLHGARSARVTNSSGRGPRDANRRAVTTSGERLVVPGGPRPMSHGVTSRASRIRPIPLGSDTSRTSRLHGVGPNPAAAATVRNFREIPRAGPAVATRYRGFVIGASAMRNHAERGTTATAGGRPRRPPTQGYRARAGRISRGRANTRVSFAVVTG